MIGFTAQLSPGNVVIATDLSLVGGRINGAIFINDIGEIGAEDVPLPSLFIELLDAHMV